MILLTFYCLFYKVVILFSIEGLDGVTVFPRIIAGVSDYFFFRTKRGRFFKGGAYFKYCSLEVK